MNGRDEDFELAQALSANVRLTAQNRELAAKLQAIAQVMSQRELDNIVSNMRASDSRFISSNGNLLRRAFSSIRSQL